jgi:putative endonuclease
MNKGRYGEDLAIKYLKDRGYRIVETNYECYLGEIDIVVFKNNRYVFVEVKSKRDFSYGRPEEMLNYYKQRKLLNLAKIYLEENDLANVDYQIDLIAIITSDKNIEINHYQNVIQED